MGYQCVLVRLRNRRIIPEAIVLNGEMLRVPDGTEPFRAEDIEAIELPEKRS
jgi:hypothetical protein